MINAAPLIRAGAYRPGDTALPLQYPVAAGAVDLFAIAPTGISRRIGQERSLFAPI